MKKTAILFCAALALVGCATTSGLDASTSVASFDGAKVVDISPHGAMWSGNYDDHISIGGQWSSAAPSMSTMKIQLSSYTRYRLIDRATLRIDGQEVDLKKTTASTQFDKVHQFSTYDSTASFSTPITTFERIAAAKDVRIRVYTPSGYVDAVILTTEGDSKAYHATKRFLGAVRSAHPVQLTQ